MNDKVIRQKVLNKLRKEQSYRYEYGTGKKEFDGLVGRAIDLTLKEAKAVEEEE